MLHKQLPIVAWIAVDVVLFVMHGSAMGWLADYAGMREVVMTLAPQRAFPNPPKLLPNPNLQQLKNHCTNVL